MSFGPTRFLCGESYYYKCYVSKHRDFLCRIISGIYIKQVYEISYKVTI